MNVRTKEKPPMLAPGIRSSLPPQAYTREAIENAARYWWQSRMTKNGVVAPLPALADIPAIAWSLGSKGVNAK